jgi:hypothetical protein
MTVGAHPTPGQAEEEHRSVPDQTGGGGGGPRPDGVPNFVGPEGDAIYVGPAPSDGLPVAVGPEGDASYFGPIPSDGVPEAVGPEGDASYLGPVPSDGVPEGIYDDAVTEPMPGPQSTPDPGIPASSTGGIPPEPTTPPAEPVRDWNQARDLGDLSTQSVLSSAGDPGSVTTAGGGAYDVTLDDGTPGVAKLLPDTSRRRTELSNELEGAYQASRTGFAGNAQGVVRAIVNGQPKIGIAMAKAQGGFIEALPPQGSTPEQKAAAQTEAARWRDAVNADTAASLQEYGERLLANGFHYGGELQFFVDDAGIVRPIDFAGIKPLSTDPVERAIEIKKHTDSFDSQTKALEKIAAENAAKRGAP